MIPPAREGRQAAQDPRPSQRREVRRCLSRRRRHRRAEENPLFRSIDTHRKLTDRPMDRNDALRMIKRRARAAGLSEDISCHTFRATGTTAYLEEGGTIEKAQVIAFHESPKTTKLYDRTSDQIDLDEIERIRI